jgi:hypothetical protein
MIHLAGSPAADSMALPGIERVWIVETAEKVLFRLYMNDRISHDYPVPKRTVFLRMSFGCWLTRWRRAVRRRPHIHRPMPKRAN